MSIGFWAQCLPFLVLLVLGFFVGGWVERAHFRRIARREEELRHIAVTDLGCVPPDCDIESCGLVTAEVVIASDYFKSFAASLRKLFGGELRTYDSLMERARREAILRLKASAQQIGANRVINLRLSTSNVGGIARRGKRRGAAAMVEMFASGTAILVP